MSFSYGEHYGNITVIIAKYFRQKLFHNIEANTYAW